MLGLKMCASAPGSFVAPDTYSTEMAIHDPAAYALLRDNVLAERRWDVKEFCSGGDKTQHYLQKKRSWHLGT